ncbi:hypothetical protein [Cupriavidus sp. RAF12]|uniref:hypothetical protein n=1 Tax=Cupriavidus sp. RAF12 TaxID=3233050 RepID=UPI003F8FBA41
MNEIKVHESSVDEQRYRAVLNHQQLLDLVAAAVAQLAGVDLSAGNVGVRTLHLSSNGGGIGSIKCEAVCEIVVDRRPPAADGAA